VVGLAFAGGPDGLLDASLARADDTPGSILELNRSADAPVELLVSLKLIAKGEVRAVDDNFAFRITEIDTRAARIRRLA